MSSIQEQLEILMQNYFGVVENLIGTLVYDRGGLLIARKEKKKPNHQILNQKFMGLSRV